MKRPSPALLTTLRPARLRVVPACLLLALILVACVQVPEPSREGLALPPIFSHNMVLQRGAPNTIWGWGPAGRPVWVRFKNLTATTKVARSGRWEVRLDLGNRLTPYPDNLLMGIGKPGQNLAAAFTNVAVGNVWLLGVCDGKGLPLPAREKLTWDRERIRFLTLPDLHSLRESPAPGEVSWQVCAPGELDLRHISAFSFYMAFGLGGDYVGVIQTSTNSLAGGLMPRASGEALPRQRLDQVRLGLQGAWIVASNEVRQAEESRQAQLDEFKQMGVITNLPPILQYDFPSIHPRATFSDTQPPASIVNFEGAIW